MLWAGKPDSALQLRWYDYLLIPLALLFAVGFCSIGTLTLLRTGISGLVFAVLFGLLTLVALYLAVGRFLVLALRKRAVTYLVTNQRILTIYNSLFGIQVRPYSYESLPALHIWHTEKAHGSITFDLYHHLPTGDAMEAPRFGSPQAGLFDIPGVDEVYRLIQRQMRERGATMPVSPIAPGKRRYVVP
ncbi:MAG: hypothetical protein SF123_12185 [Chloroflexota bacterium]|nr:hypothetical protein [Chloroflexota bacterium]